MLAYETAQILLNRGERAEAAVLVADVPERLRGLGDENAADVEQLRSHL